MNVIAIETTGPFASVAIINDNNDLEEIMGDEKMNHLKNVVPMIQTLLERNDLTMEDVSRSSLPLILAAFLALTVIILFPGLSTFMPKLLGL